MEHYSLFDFWPIWLNILKIHKKLPFLTSLLAGHLKLKKGENLFKFWSHLAPIQQLNQLNLLLIHKIPLVSASECFGEVFLES